MSLFAGTEPSLLWSVVKLSSANNNGWEPNKKDSSMYSRQ